MYENLTHRGVTKCSILPLDFGSTLVVAEDARKNSKVWATDAIVSMLQRENLGVPNDPDFLHQFRNHTVDVSRGRPRYSKVEDHIVDAARCLVYGFFQDSFPGSGASRKPVEPIPSVVKTAAPREAGAPRGGTKMKVRGMKAM